MQPLVSVIVPVFNEEARLMECAVSILEQTYDRIELIIVDDGSTDGTSVVCDQVSSRDSRVRVIRLENGGVSRARNFGMEIARGEFLRFVDADDRLPERSIELLFSSQKKSGSDIVTGGFVQWHEELNQREEFLPPFCGSLTRRELFEKLPQIRSSRVTGYCWNSLYRAELIRTNRITFASDMPFGEDEVFNLDGIRGSRTVSFVGDLVYVRRMHSYGKTLSTRFHKNIYDLELRRLSSELSLFESLGAGRNAELELSFCLKLATHTIPYMAMGSSDYREFIRLVSIVHQDATYQRFIRKIQPHGVKAKALAFFSRPRWCCFLWGIARVALWTGIGRGNRVR